MKKYIVHDTVQPSSWNESTLLGCGRMGAAVMAKVSMETIYLNEETVWSEKTQNRFDPQFSEKIKQIRDLFLKNKPAEANRLAHDILSNSFLRIGSFESAGKLQIELHEGDAAVNYSHSLDLINGIATVEYTKGGSLYKREYFASRPDNVIVCRLTSSSTPLNACIAYERDLIFKREASGNELTVCAKTLFGDHAFCTKVRVITDGTVTACNGKLLISDAKDVCIYVSIGSEFSHGKDYVDKTTFPSKLDYDAIRLRHITDFSALMSRADVTLPTIDGIPELSISELFKGRKYNGIKDEYIFTLLWQFGRYLLVSSSREGTLPANLQGIWTENLTAPWSGDYHTNVNIQINYWASEIVNLSECQLPLFDYMNNYLLESGKKTAKRFYDARGCVVHHLSDIYGYTAPADGLWGLWPHGASWLSLHMWEHYLFTGDEKFLREKAYEFIHQSVLFFIDTMVLNDSGQMVYAPSTSPENSYLCRDENGNTCSCHLAVSSTMDVEIIYTLLDIYLKSSKLLGIENKDVTDAQKALSLLPPLRVGKHGQLMEWIEDYDESDPGHRHISHAFGLYPAAIINRSTPELCSALDVTFKRRLSASVGQSFSAWDIGWSLGWFGCAFARLRHADQAYSKITSFINRRIFPSLMEYELFDFGNAMGSPDLYFQIDGNFGYLAAMSEMLIQSHEGVVALIPAIPSQWHSGSFRGLCARGGYELDIEWENGDVMKINVKAKSNGECVLELPSSQKTSSFQDQNGNVYTSTNNLLTISTTGNDIITLKALR